METHLSFKKGALGCSVLAVLATAGSCAQKLPDKPNVLFIMTDQQSYNMMSCMGNKWLSTPNMDKIANMGYRFEKTYCANPVSMTSRFSLLTGHYASEVGVKANTSAYDSSKVKQIVSVDGLGIIFRKAGYETLYSGKTHLYGTNDLS
ncbi:MAG: sulfatase-like hydrolase/transferase [Bacteroidia bacterium]|nr:sulfatase-like hydrolase/transferase [Bacteroidia bacterium]